jgi:hypothetical protein
LFSISPRLPECSLCVFTATCPDARHTNGYPRDLVGYADQLPDPRWPGGARLALNFVVNYEEGGERSVLHGDKVAETRLTDLLMPAPLQGARDLNGLTSYRRASSARVAFCARYSLRIRL